MDAGAALDALIFINLAYAILVVGNRVYRAGLLARALQMCDRVVRAGICALAAFLTLVRINVGAGIPHADSSEITGILAGLSHTFSAVIGYRVRCDRTLLTGCPNDLDHVSGIFTAGRAFALCQADTLTDNLALFINAAAELCLRSRDDGVRNLILVFLIQLASPCQLCYLIQYVVFDA